MDAKKLYDPNEAILENIRRANEIKFRSRVKGNLKTAKPAEKLMVDFFKGMWHTRRVSK